MDACRESQLQQGASHPRGRCPRAHRHPPETQFTLYAQEPLSVSRSRPAPPCTKSHRRCADPRARVRADGLFYTRGRGIRRMAQVLWDLWRRNYGTARRNCGILQGSCPSGHAIVMLPTNGVAGMDVCPGAQAAGRRYGCTSGGRRRALPRPCQVGGRVRGYASLLPFDALLL